MFQTTNTFQCPTPSVQIIFDKTVYQYRVHQVQENNVTNVLIAGMYGVLVVLSIQAVHAMLRSWKTQGSPIFLSLTILALFTSTTIYVVITVIYNEALYLDGLLLSVVDFWEILPSPDFYSEMSVWELQKDYTWLYLQVGMATGIINIILGNATVCWRAWVVWGRNRGVQVVCVSLVSATFVIGLVAAFYSDATLFSDISTQAAFADPTGYISVVNGRFGIILFLLSLTTNIVAMLLIAYKAWTTRTPLKKYFVAKTGASQAEKLVAILIESGALFCPIWIVILVYQISSYNYGKELLSELRWNGLFLNLVIAVMNRALVPAIAVYSMLIILLIALNMSHIEKGLTWSTQSIPSIPIST